MGDFSDPRDFTEKDIKEILLDEYLPYGAPPIKGVSKLFDDLHNGRLNYKIKVWQTDYLTVQDIIGQIAKEEIVKLAERAS